MMHISGNILYVRRRQAVLRRHMGPEVMPLRPSVWQKTGRRRKPLVAMAGNQTHQEGRFPPSLPLSSLFLLSDILVPQAPITSQWNNAIN